MRLPERLRDPIRTALMDMFGDVPVYLFGSRADDTKKGGDIDLAVATEMEKAEFRSKRIKFIAKMTRKNFEIQIDVVQLADRTDPLLKNEILSTGILLG
ncbi:MAG: hypothetical protein A2Z99_03750 [Treponema sp. GWB1_62_6]|nr:MAG: hypothetical protein A2Y36_13285 [Treponema sp. GWA1_62_8]OHE62640.1 MAG: hypothetical protein A2Z99_03750 [Treponema sp. GWB1_62_6]OHE65006.1 MAG: hypothetical protein A2001_17050 [Treponema sp. GWC1_61_84]HCM26025.1 nucleotidyltransferase domain-containing protein [Treponema sp.]